ncbi:MAG: AsmA-like C-terminal region-containing protein [Chloroflexota bacterium]
MSEKHHTVKRVAIVIAVLLIISAAIFGSISYLRGDKIKNLLLGELNKHLTTEVTVRQIELSFLKSFPYASLILNDVVIKAPRELNGSPGLLSAKVLMLRFNLISVITGKYTIHSIYVKNASISFYEDGLGHKNYNILKSTGTTSGNEVNFNIRKLTIEESKAYYRNTGRNDDIAVSIGTLAMKGALQAKQFTMKLKGNFHNDKLIVSGTTILPAGQAKAETLIEINTIKELLDFKQSVVTFENIQTEFNGKYSFGNISSADFIVKSIKGEVPQILKVIPPWVADFFNPYRPEGLITAHGSIKGPGDDPEKWKISVTGDLTNGKLTYETDKLAFHDVEVSGSLYYAGKTSSEVLNLSKFSGKLGSGNFKGTAMIRNFADAHGTITLHVNTNIKELENLLTNDYFTQLNGKLIADVAYNGPLTGNNRIDRNIKGEATFSDAGFVYNKEPVSEMNGSVEFRENKLFLDGFTCTIGTSDLKANGTIDNLVGYFLGDKKNVLANLSLYSNRIVLEDLIGLVASSGSESVSTSIFPPNIAFNSVVSISSLTYKKLNTENITGSFSLKDDILRGSNINIKALGGTIAANGLINGRYGNKAQIVSEATFNNVDINKLFYQFDNFGQKSLVSDNLKGTGDAKVDFATSLYSNFTINTETIEAVADLEIRNGELNDFEPLQALSRFLDARELKNVKFATLKNRIEITHKTVLIPRMEINSSALNLIGYGTHTFGNDIDYHVNILLSDVLKAKRKKHDEAEQYVEDDGLGKPRLFLRLTGPIDDPIVKYDTQAVSKKIANDLKNEKKVLKDALRKEFGKKSVSPAPNGSKTTEKPSTEFQIEWDETK